MWCNICIWDGCSGGGGRIDDMYSNNFDFKEDNLQSIWQSKGNIIHFNNIKQPT